jgi:hypothetical protein
MNYSKALFLASFLTIFAQISAMEPETSVTEVIEIEAPMSGEDTNPIFDAPESHEETNFPTRRTGDTAATPKSNLQRRIEYPQEEKKPGFFDRIRK